MLNRDVSRGLGATSGDTPFFRLKREALFQQGRKGRCPRHLEEDGAGLSPGGCSGPSCRQQHPQAGGGSGPGHARGSRKLRPGSAAPAPSRGGAAGGRRAHAHCGRGNPRTPRSPILRAADARMRSPCSQPGAAENDADACALTTAARTAVPARSRPIIAGVRLAHARGFPPAVARPGNGSPLGNSQSGSAARLRCLRLGSATAIRLRGAPTGLRPPVPRGRAEQTRLGTRPPEERADGRAAHALSSSGSRAVCAHAPCAERFPPHAEVRGQAAAGHRHPGASRDWAPSRQRPEHL